MVIAEANDSSIESPNLLSSCSFRHSRTVSAFNESVLKFVSSRISARMLLFSRCASSTQFSQSIYASHTYNT